MTETGRVYFCTRNQKQFLYEKNLDFYPSSITCNL